MLEKENGVHERLQSRLTLFKERRLERFELALGIETFLQLLHVRVLALAINCTHFHKVLTLVVKVTHDILQRIFAETIKQMFFSFDSGLGALARHNGYQAFLQLL